MFKNINLKVTKNYLKHYRTQVRDKFLEIGVDQDHVHFLVQTVPIYSPAKVVRTIKNITAREMFLKFPDLKKKIMG